MVLVIGGKANGKLDFVRQHLGYNNADIANATLDDRPVLNNLQDLMLADPSSAESIFPTLLTKSVIICDEVGSGIVPIDRAARHWREAVGRLCCRLAEQATAVIRLQCGIAILIKGDLTWK
ncbi:MAG: bifunctional adenosylcobinamide kinase/adenosylcobinamide-phosphate guanylyltransferase [Oscillospiraceae bacterium]|jgi:adenosyl cobinamide kinase/adenosyl cobinamide phosphate guanylyltransferase|nr:bifunctional adenosylcobinamide kinase/adenosylcobinamide-phosphate guanylyltransferase [Oscillospiraceae bacterium]